MGGSGSSSDRDVTIPLNTELLEVGRRSVVTGTVRVATATMTRDETIDLDLVRETVEIERVPINRFVDEAPPMREEGDAVIIPVLEEVVVTRLRLREEVRVRRVRSTRRHHEVVPLRSEDVSVTRSPPAGATETTPEG